LDGPGLKSAPEYGLNWSPAKRDASSRTGWRRSQFAEGWRREPAPLAACSGLRREL